MIVWIAGSKSCYAVCGREARRRPIEKILASVCGLGLTCDVSSTGSSRWHRPTTRTLQQHLGEINDHATAQARLRHRIDTADELSEADHLRRLLVVEHARMNQARRKFLQFCTPRRNQYLRTRFNGLLAGRNERATAFLEHRNEAW
jgi:hypothetical protein